MLSHVRAVSFYLFSDIYHGIVSEFTIFKKVLDWSSISKEYITKNLNDYCTTKLRQKNLSDL